jgi:multisubunit Na+/H+ antiporter MnhB subunit
MAAPDEVYRGVTRLFSVVITGFGLAIVIVTIANGGGPLSSGLLIGVIFTLLGLGRFYLSTRNSA